MDIIESKSQNVQVEERYDTIWYGVIGSGWVVIMRGQVVQGYMNKEEEITDEIIIVPVRELSYEDAKKEIIKYLEGSGKRTVYVSEIMNS